MWFYEDNGEGTLCGTFNFSSMHVIILGTMTLIFELKSILINLEMNEMAFKLELKRIENPKMRP